FREKQGGRQGSNLVNVDGTYTPTSNLYFNARYSRGFLNEKNGNYFVPVTTGVTCSGSATAQFGCSSVTGGSITLRDVSIRESYDFSGNYIFNGGGRHELRAGYQRQTIANDVALGNTSIGG